ncbi:DUF2292 domain-containing protein [Aliibacillus thermotolerans]|uniref:DUF2292 domain-containing protein n=1 Tax=Aliibacillus thermotolerans TaxID=1834418 RepID=A0ABW0U421_9BACI|nr:YezD family protein [Aliibacillus thermotolerans]MDA3130103.1 DUF2292 domain-containing protein [Aliibacillus thermotolerans]
MGQQEDLEKTYEKLKVLLKDLKYGSITIVVQDGKIVQMEKKEKLRFT